MQHMIIRRGRTRPRRHRRWQVPALGLLLAAASCVPAASTRSLTLAAPPAAAQTASAGTSQLPLSPLALNETVADNSNPAANPFLFRAAAARDELRSLDCLTAAIYYEAASEPEDGQRAVAQVVLNRVRHSGYPNSVCGVVYQGPMRVVPGLGAGGCQFTFTCDGSLARTPSASGWARARRIAADALTGEVYAPVGLATHYHADYVLPAWAPSLSRVAVIGAHIFYRLPGSGGAPAAFLQRYAGREPLPVPARTYVAPVDAPSLASLAAVPVAAAADRLPSVQYTALAPQSQVREQYRNSGRPLADLR